MAGLAAKQVKSGKVGFIVALDPAGFGFSLHYRENRLDKSNADYVQVIHTDIDKFGIAEPIGHGLFQFLTFNISCLEEMYFFDELLNFDSRLLSELWSKSAWMSKQNPLELFW